MGGGLGGVHVKRGITLLAAMEFDSCFLKPLSSVFKHTIFQVYGTIPFVPVDPWSLSASLAMTFDKSTGIIGSAVSVSFMMVPPNPTAVPPVLVAEIEVEIKGKIATVVNSEQLEFEMTATVSFSVTIDLKLEGDMIGCWEKALGLPGFSICDVGLGIGFTLPAPFPPTYFRIQGGFIIGKLKFGMKLEVDFSGGGLGLMESGLLGFFKGSKLCYLDMYWMPV